MDLIELNQHATELICLTPVPANKMQLFSIDAPCHFESEHVNPYTVSYIHELVIDELPV